MFKKEVTLGRQNAIKASALRKLKEQLLATYPLLEAPKAHEKLDGLLGHGKKASVSAQHLVGSRTIVYRDGRRQPLFFDLDERGDLFPSVYSLWVLPQFMTTLYIQANTIEFLKRGADLMWPGVVAPDGLPYFDAGAKLAIAVIGYPKAIAVGTAIMSSGEAAMEGMKGKGVKILHIFGDHLWRMGTKTRPPQYPPNVSQNPADHEGDIEGDDEEEEETAEKPEAREAQEDGEKEKKDTENEGDKEYTETEKGEGKGGEEDAEEVKEAESGLVTPEEMDRLLWISALQACKTKVRPKALPLLANAFFSEYLLKSRPVNTSIDLKQSSYKKLLPFLRTLEEKGVITLAEPSEGVFHITDVNRSNRELREYEGHDVYEEDENEEEGDVSDKIEPVSAIVEVWKLPAPLLFLLQQEDPEKNQYFSLSELTKVLWDYVAEKDLTSSTNKKALILNEPLWKELFGKRSGKAVGDEVDKKEVALKLKNKLLPYHIITVDGVQETRSGLPQSITIRVDARQGGQKFTTTVQGLKSWGISCAQLAHILSKQFSASATVKKVQGTQGRVRIEVMVQGNRSDVLEQLLTKQYEVPTKFIEVVLSKLAKKGPDKAGVRGGRGGKRR